MKRFLTKLIPAALAVVSLNAAAVTRYVDLNSPGPTPPYTNWPTAATNIQDAIDAASDGDEIIVTNGIYKTGGRPVFGTLTNRVVVDKVILVQSVNGPTVTTIEGNSVMGDSAVRCAYLANGARLVGFTITNGATRSAGDTVLEQSGGGLWCESSSAVVSNCVLVSNSASYSGGGASSGTLNNCTVSGNYAGYRGGGTYASTLNQCRLIGNSAGISAGGAREGFLNNCLIVSNSAQFTGGAEWATLNHCTVTANSGSSVGGLSICNTTNCIVYYNSGSEPNYQSGTFGTLDHCCTTPMPASNLGVGNFTNPPVFLNQAAGDYHLMCSSACVNTGNDDSVTSAVDLDGNPRVGDGIVDVGAYEFLLTAPLALSIQKDPMNLLPNHPASFTGTVDMGCARTTFWDFGDGTTLSNQLAVSHTWTTVGDYPVVLWAFNELNPGGVSVTAIVHVATQRIHYVDASNLDPVPPYSSWATAATNIQDAIDVALPVPNSLVLVTNGVYRAGGRVVYGTLTNRVAVTKPIVVRSINGPSETTIQGYQSPSWGSGSVRCVYMTNGATLVGFTLTGGSSQLVDNQGGGVWCESTNALVADCVLSNNTVFYAGGGAYSGTLSNCTLAGNLAHSIGGGAYSSVLISCAVSDNTAAYPFSDGGGGTRACVLFNCTLTRNSAIYGGGDFGSVLYNCVLTANSASKQGGGACNSTLNNCTVTGNSAGLGGGGVSGGTLNNCLVYYNSASSGPNYSGSSLNYCCTLPLPSSGLGNITTEPQLADSFHLSAGSPCRAAGNAAYAAGTDVDGEPWLNPPSIGCDEYHAGAITGPLSVTLQASATNAVVWFVVNFTGQVLGHATSNHWDFGDGTGLTNLPGTVSHNWSLPGDYTVTFRAFNESCPAGVSASVLIRVVEEIHYVTLESTNPVSPYVTWTTAATNIQDAIDAAVLPGASVLVSNGVYQTGGRVVSGALTNRVAVDKAVTVQSVNGPTVTIIQGYQVPGTTNGNSAVRCVYLTNGAALIGFTLTNGATLTTGVTSGGGIWCSSTNSVVSNCVLIGNSAYSAGGGAWSGTLNNCSVVGNSVLAPGIYPGAGAGGPSGGGTYASSLNNCKLVGNLGFLGGGASSGTLNNCTIVSNQAARGGGTYSSSLNNCTIMHNSAANSGGGNYQSTLNNCVVVSNVATNGTNYSGGSLNYCCTIPFPPSGLGNITNDPAFADFAGGDLRLQSHSACINAGNNAYVTSATDLNGSTRIVGGTVDIGAYEFQSPSSVLSFAWAQRYGLPADGSADFTDLDGDGVSNWGEWRADTIPTNTLSVLRMVNATNSPSGVKVTWQSVFTRSYWLERATNLGAASPFQTIATNIAGVAGTKTFTDNSATNAVQFFYRVGVY
jgi:parallel beta-helix repeat protein